MPAVYAHKRFGERVFEFLPIQLKEAFAPYKDCFMLGLEGPDIFFYHKPFKANETRKRALQMHYDSAKDFFISAAEKICAQDVANPKSTPLAAYTAGFICHFTLDNACHPRVYEVEDTGVSHGRIESEFDKYILRKEGNRVFGVNHSKHFKATKQTLHASATILDAKECELRRCISTLKFINGAFACRYVWVHNLIQFLLKKLNAQKKYGGMLFHHEDEPACLVSNPYLYKDLENAIPLGVKTVSEYFNNLKATAQTGAIDEIFDRDYRGGKIHE